MQESRRRDCEYTSHSCKMLRTSRSTSGHTTRPSVMYGSGHADMQLRFVEYAINLREFSIGLLANQGERQADCTRRASPGCRAACAISLEKLGSREWLRAAGDLAE